MISKKRELNMWKKRELKMWHHFYLNGKLYYQTFSGYCYVVEFNYDTTIKKTTRISYSEFEWLHTKRYDY